MCHRRSDILAGRVHRGLLSCSLHYLKQSQSAHTRSGSQRNTQREVTVPLQFFFNVPFEICYDAYYQPIPYTAFALRHTSVTPDPTTQEKVCNKKF